jgi:hypothetical protein
MNVVKSMTQARASDLVRRHTLSDDVLALLRKAPGLRLLNAADQQVFEHKSVSLNAAGEMREALGTGFEVDGIQTFPEGTAQARLSRVSGMVYPS